mmetsp:Transcript_10526/g.25901  ORF Transcript_10526/g.25901 Transcript_10526/m.25901 type:complete len:231 (-) Transcript_10526:43-735(-)
MTFSCAYVVWGSSGVRHRIASLRSWSLSMPYAGQRRIMPLLLSLSLPPFFLLRTLSLFVLSGPFFLFFPFPSFLLTTLSFFVDPSSLAFFLFLPALLPLPSLGFSPSFLRKFLPPPSVDDTRLPYHDGVAFGWDHAGQSLLGYFTSSSSSHPPPPPECPRRRPPYDSPAASCDGATTSLMNLRCCAFFLFLSSLALSLANTFSFFFVFSFLFASSFASRSDSFSMSLPTW